jgi:acetoin utilization deacetylase AcuC-like enzyme
VTDPGRRVLLLTADAMDAHSAHGHPERPERRGAVADGVRDAAGDALVEETPVAATDATLLAVHDAAYLAALDVLDGNGGGWLDADTYIAAGSMTAARLAAGATVRAAQAVAAGEVAVGFAAVRPPGHHAMRARAGGFCLVNNVAVAVAALRASGAARRVAIVDWDVHHGDGTQAIFDADPDCWYGSTHQMPLFPGTGAASEVGNGPAIGTKLNVPLAPGSDDDDFVAAWAEELLPSAEAFEPDAILVSTGYDGHREDPLANLRITERGYEIVARELGATIARLGLPGAALTLEGGYDLDALRASAAATVRGLLVGLAADA